MSFQGFVTPGIVEELYISGDQVIFRNYSVVNALDLGSIGTPVSVKWGIKDNHFFVQVGTGADAVFRIYTLDRAAEGAIYQPGIIPNATLVKTLPLSAMNVSVCVVTFELSRNLTIPTYHVTQVDGGGQTSAFLDFDFLETRPTLVHTFRLTSDLLTTPAPLGGTKGNVSADFEPENAVLDGDLNLLLPFRLKWIPQYPPFTFFNPGATWVGWTPYGTGNQSLTQAGTTFTAVVGGLCAVGAYSNTFDQSPASAMGWDFDVYETHAVVVNLNDNTVVYSTLPATTTRHMTQTGRRFYADGVIPLVDMWESWDSVVDQCTPYTTNQEAPTGTNLGALGLGGITVGAAVDNESTLYSSTFPFVSVSSLFETVDAAATTGEKGVGVATTVHVQFTSTLRTLRPRWRLVSEVVALAGRRSSGPLSGHLEAAVLYLRQLPTKIQAAWANDVEKSGYFLLRGSGLTFSTALLPMQTDIPQVTIMSLNQKYLLWNIPGHVYRTTLASGDTIEVGTDPTKFTSRDLRLIHPVYLYSQAETNDDEGIEGHFFVDIESTPLPTTDLPVTGSLVKWDMFNPVDDLKHL